MFNILHYSKCVCYVLLTILKEGGGWGWGFWNDSLLLYSELERMVSPAESLSSLLSSKAGNVRGLVFLLHFCMCDSQLDLVLDLTGSFQRVIAGIGWKKSGSGPSMQIRIRVLKIFFQQWRSSIRLNLFR